MEVFNRGFFSMFIFLLFSTRREVEKGVLISTITVSKKRTYVVISRSIYAWYGCTLISLFARVIVVPVVIRYFSLQNEISYSSDSKKYLKLCNNDKTAQYRV